MARWNATEPEIEVPPEQDRAEQIARWQALKAGVREEQTKRESKLDWSRTQCAPGAAIKAWMEDERTDV